MKKGTLLNSALSQLIATLGHGDMLVIGDAGLPIPPGTARIDLALTGNVPGFLETLRVVLDEVQVQNAIVAEETGQASPGIMQAIVQLLPGVPLSTVSHDALKEATRAARAVVRTGELTSYANMVLVAGVVS